MISRALARDIEDFRTLIESHLARMIEAFHARTIKETKDRKDELLDDALVIAFRTREVFDPQMANVQTWFGTCLDIALTEKPVKDEDSRYMLAVLNPPAVVLQERKSVGTWVSEDNQLPLDLIVQKKVKDCPPCWRCRYFDGWLPSKAPEDDDYPPTEIGWICRDIDRRKIEIAGYVQGRYAEDLLGD